MGVVILASASESNNKVANIAAEVPDILYPNGLTNSYKEHYLLKYTVYRSKGVVLSITTYLSFGGKGLLVDSL